MHVAELIETSPPPERRRFARHQVQCRARILIGSRHYAGYLHDISSGGARLRTISPIRKLGEVILRLPDLPPLRGRVRWNNSYNAGVAFELVVARRELSRWVRTRAARGSPDAGEIAELEFLP